MNIYEKLYDGLIRFGSNRAFFLGDKYYTYSALNDLIARIQHFALHDISDNRRIGVVADDRIETYASFLAILFKGCAFVPIDPSHPDDRNNEVVSQAGLELILCPDNSGLSDGFLRRHKDKIADVSALADTENPVRFKSVGNEDTAYILFTSGSTGIPKGVPIRRKSLISFVSAIEGCNYKISEKDRFLQVFDLTFDLSIFSWLIPLLNGACVYTIPKTSVRYAYACDLAEEHEITIALTVPSFIHFLKPYFDEIRLPSVRLWLFCGEALQQDITSAWQKCLPNAAIENVYGPTEATIFCLRYPCSKTIVSDKSLNGILSIGKPFPGIGTIIIDENKNMLPAGQSGELCLSGDQITPGYLNNLGKNRDAFFVTDFKGEKTRFYRTGDLCYEDPDGDYMFTGRIDTQVKIQGFRVELGEIENRAREQDGVQNAVALAHTDERGNTTIHLFIETSDTDIPALLNHLKAKLPVYMLPKQVYPVKNFPLNVNGKTDKPELRKRIQS